jgi:hypothetical protein
MPFAKVTLSGCQVLLKGLPLDQLAFSQALSAELNSSSSSGCQVISESFFDAGLGWLYKTADMLPIDLILSSIPIFYPLSISSSAL